MFKRLLLSAALLMLSTLMVGSLAHAWSEPAIAPIMMTAPLTPPPVTGTTYYVDKSSLGGTCGDTNPGTQTQPWCTLAKAMQMVHAGDQVFVRNGTYLEGDLRPANTGTTGNYITFRAYPGESPKLDCSGRVWCLNGWSPNAPSYLVYDGFEMYGPKQQFMSCEGSAGCHHIWIINGKYHDNGLFRYTGFRFPDTYGNVISNNEFYNMAQAAGDGNAHDHIYEFNTIHDVGRDNDDDGAIKSLTSWNTVMRYNTVYNNYRTPSSLVPCWIPTACQGVTGLYIDTGKDGDHPGAMSYIYNNRVWGNDIGIQAWATHTARIFNNVVCRNGYTPGAGQFTHNFGMGITTDSDQTSDVQVLNNTIYDNKTVGLNFGAAQTAMVSRNNIIMNNGGAEVFAFPGTNIDADYDLIADTAHPSMPLISWSGTDYLTLAAFRARPGNTIWLHALASLAQFVDAAARDFHPLRTSPANDAGTIVSLFSYDLENRSRPQGPAFDIGAYEYWSDGISPPTGLHLVK